jgi:hypothetical protein
MFVGASAAVPKVFNTQKENLLVTYVDWTTAFSKSHIES